MDRLVQLAVLGGEKPETESSYSRFNGSTEPPSERVGLLVKKCNTMATKNATILYKI
ncbi:hypothetical protein LEP3755_18670 [Leptolyngbya sp. NIES-3755]|nr:hypothetical protein LEP3755_18670 [Leptolyngbya sp. NIES-3755]